jgi:hypothetical protein
LLIKIEGTFMRLESRLLVIAIAVLIVLVAVQGMHIFTKKDVTIHISEFNYNPKTKDNTAIQSGSSIYQNDVFDRTKLDDWASNYERLAPDKPDEDQYVYFGKRYYNPPEAKARFLEMDQIPEMPDSLIGKNPLKDIDVNGFKKRFQ